MASLTLAEAAKYSQNPLVQGVMKEFLTPDLFATQIPFIALNGGKARFFNRESTDPKTTVGALDVAGTPVASQATITQITHILGRLGGDAQVDNFESVTLSDINDQMDEAVSKKARGLGRLFRQYVIKGSGTFPQFNGIDTLVDSSNMWQAASSTTAGGALTFALLDQTMDLVVQDGERLFFTMDKTNMRKMKALYRALGGIEPEKVEIGWIDPISGDWTGRKVMSYSGVPIFRNDNITAESTYGKTGKYRVSFGVFDEDNGLVGIMPSDNDPGVRTFPIGQKDALAEEAVRVELYTGLSLSSTKGLGQLVNVLN